MDTTTLELVAAAFDRLLDKIEASGCDPAYGQTVYFAKIDVLDRMSSTWNVEEAAVEPVEAGQWGTF